MQLVRDAHDAPVPAKKNFVGLNPAHTQLKGLPDAYNQLWPTTTHSDVDTHDTAVNDGPPVIVVSFHADFPPPGLVDVKTAPPFPTATQKWTDGQDTEAIVRWLFSTFVTVHAVAPPVGFVEVATSPPPPTATHSVRDGHDTP
jgi:hypothetical protein